MIYKLTLNNKIVLCTNSATEADKVYLDFTKQFPNKNILLITAISVLDKPINLDDWKNIDMLIYSPKINSGISYEFEHFDVIYGYFNCHSCSALGCIQMLGRIRNISIKFGIICFGNESILRRLNDFKLTENDIIENDR